MFKYWSEELHLETFIVVIVGQFVMLLATLCNSNNVKYVKHNFPNSALINSKKYWVGIFICIVLTIYYVLEILKVGAFLGALSSADAISVTKHREADDIQMNFYAKQGVKIIFALAYIHSFVFIYNYLKTKSIVNNLKHLIPPICLIVSCLFTGVRTDIFKLLSAMLIMFVILARDSEIRVKKYLWKGGVVIIMAVSLAGVVNKLVKGKDANINNSYNAVEICAYYVGSPLQVLNMKIGAGITTYRDNHIWGRTTFSRQYADIEKFGLCKVGIGDNIGSMNVLLDKKNFILANVDTVLGAPYIDFGMFGMVLYVFMLYYLFSWFYYKKLRSYEKYRKKMLHLLIYSFYYVIPVMAYYACLPNLIFSFSYWVELFLMILIFEFYFAKVPVQNAKGV